MSDTKVTVKSKGGAYSASVAVKHGLLARGGATVATEYTHASEAWALRALEYVLSKALDDVRAALAAADACELPALQAAHAAEIARGDS